MKEHWDEFSTLMAAGEEKQAGKEEFAYKDSGEGESEMVVCVRVRPRLMPFRLYMKSCANGDPNAHFTFFQRHKQTTQEQHGRCSTALWKYMMAGMPYENE